MNLQDSFLNQVRKDNTEIKLVLMDGSELIGAVKGFDNFTVILAEKTSQHLVYKHAIAQIISQKPVGRRDDSASGGNEPAAKTTSAKRDNERSSHKDDSFNTLDLSRVTVPEAG